jgi:histidine triad (HIT) family protein
VEDQTCIFCQIGSGARPAAILYETPQVLAFRDIHPVAPVHVLIIPRQHIADLSSLDESTFSVVAEMFQATKIVAQAEGVAVDGYRLVMNQGRHGGQSVFHMHLHLLAGRSMRWPPG